GRTTEARRQRGGGVARRGIPVRDDDGGGRLRPLRQRKLRGRPDGVPAPHDARHRRALSGLRQRADARRPQLRSLLAGDAGRPTPAHTGRLERGRRGSGGRGV
ncbi:MAG: hypothetical protein AVDCRST_MAG02-931, partial [uncultured Rubrobacteraceae bacterium]